MIVIYFGNKKIEFCLPDDKVGNNLSDVKLPERIFNEISTFLNNSDDNPLSIDLKGVDKGRKMSHYFKFIPAAGGLVFDEKGHMLFIFRRGKWDLPKGKIDKGESPEIAAVREVKEECGLHKVKLKKKICSTYHIYLHKDRLALKQTYWYRMVAPGKQELIPQTEEDISKAIWLSPDECGQVASNTFPSILEVLDKANISFC
ncbi:MAG: NUDIX hydrolase [Bacteroidetes bacterium HGW-Bacteroidetes-21]|jgi:8-oxo-dGTP pyrophosphatase MutT (NUDIX family)|nr:MAG: NUDIX hydrolase [Bacteroidetes bacterium HGW-Bacteroidetes-21]